MTCHTISNVQLFNLDTRLDFYFCISSNLSVVYHLIDFIFSWYDHLLRTFQTDDDQDFVIKMITQIKLRMMIRIV